VELYADIKTVKVEDSYYGGTGEWAVGFDTEDADITILSATGSYWSDSIGDRTPLVVEMWPFWDGLTGTAPGPSASAATLIGRKAGAGKTAYMTAYIVCARRVQ
jgi:hypothetical protein